MSKKVSKLFAFQVTLAIVLSTLPGLSVQHVQAVPSRGVPTPAGFIPVVPPTSSVDLSTYLRIGRFNLPEPTRTSPPANSLLAQEASAVTYDSDTDSLFVVGDGGTSVVQVSKTGQLINSMTLAPGPSPQGTDFYDTEGITYVGGGKFVLMEERDRQANLFTYVAGGVLHRTDVQSVKLGTTVGNIGLEGISFDPLTGGFICVKEKDPQSTFQTNIDFAAGTETSGTGTFKTAPLPNAAAALHFAFSGDNDGLMRPYALAGVIPSQHLDFYINLGDVIYETASNLTTSGPHNSQPWLNSPSVTLSNDSLSFDGIPRSGTTFATQPQLKADYQKKYREIFLPVNTDGQNSLQVLYAAQGNYTTWDNHELGNRKYIDGGAPAGGSVGGTAGTDMPSGRGVDARAYTGSNTGGSGNINNVNDAADLLSATDLASLGGFMNRAIGFQTLENVFLTYQPIADRGTVNAPSDPRTNGTKRLYSAIPWGKNAIYINTDSRSYRDIRLKTANAAADDTGSRADNPNRTYLGVTQLAWLKQTLLDAHNGGTTWKFVSVSDPIDQLGPIGGALAGTLTSVNTDGGKSYMGGHRAERNSLLKFIAENHISNVVFLSTDDHQNRINELYYSPSGQTNLQASYVKVPYTFSIVCGPLGATGPDTILDHSIANIKAIADSLANAQTAAGINPVGLENYPGLHDLDREGDPTAGTNPQALDFYSPDTFNFTVLDVGADGRTLTVSSVGMNATAQNAGIEYSSGPQARTIFSFQIDGFGLNQTIAFGPLTNKTFGDPPVALSATASSGLPISFAASGNCIVTAAAATITGAGSCTITASQPGDSNYGPAPNVSGTFSIARAPVTATSGSGEAIYDGTTKMPSICVVTGPYKGSLVCANSPASVGPAPGTTVIIPAVAGDNLINFSITPVNGSFTIDSLRATTQAIRTELNNALATARNRKDIESLRGAIERLDEALEPDLWMPDGNHLACKQGDRAFDRDKEAVKKFMEMIKDTSTPAIPDATIQRWINILLATDRNLAQTAITEANVPGADPKKIADALEDLAKGDAAAGLGGYDKAIEDYRKAWRLIKECDDN